LLAAALDSQERTEDGRPLRRGDDALLLRLWTEAYGKPGDPPPAAPVEQPLTWEEEVAQLVAAMEAQGIVQSSEQPAQAGRERRIDAAESTTDPVEASALVAEPQEDEFEDDIVVEA
jgi:hypothetical protein